MSEMTAALAWEPSETTRFAVLDLIDKAMSVHDVVRCDITREMIRKRVGALQEKFWQ